MQGLTRDICRVFDSCLLDTQILLEFDQERLKHSGVLPRALGLRNTSRRRHLAVKCRRALNISVIEVPKLVGDAALVTVLRH